MSTDPVTTLVALRHEREQAVARLSELYAHDVLDLEEFERRVTLAQIGDTVPAIRESLADLEPAETESPAVVDRPVTSPDALMPQATIAAVLGAARRAGAWTPPRQLRVVALLGGVELDFREARLPAGPIDVSVAATLGGVQIVVPPWLPVITEGSGVLGGFDGVCRSSAQPDPGAPLLRVHGLAVLGGVQVTMRLPGESVREAHRRHRRQRRAWRHGGGRDPDR